MIYNFNNKFYKYKYMNKIIIISVLVYGYFFFKLGNTVYRTNSLGDKSLNLMSLLEGFVGPIRSLFLLIRYSGIIPALTFLKFEFFLFQPTFAGLDLDIHRLCFSIFGEERLTFVFGALLRFQERLA